MSNTAFDNVCDELVELQEAHKKPLQDGQPAMMALLKKHGWADFGELRDHSDPALYDRIISEARELAEAERERAGKLPRLVPTFDAILKFIRWLDDGRCSSEDKHRIYATMHATEDLDPIRADHLLKELKRKLPGTPPIDLIRKESAAAGRRAHNSALPNSAEPVIFRHHETDTLHGGIYDPNVDRFVPDFGLAQIKGRDSIANICAQTGCAPMNPASIPSGAFEFLPGNPRQVIKTNAGAYRVNKWAPPEMRERAMESSTVPPTIRKLLLHVLGSDQGVYEHFLNWLGVAYQTNSRTGTAWVIAGCPGTGKGLLFDEIITPLFGVDYCLSMTASQVEDRFNEWFAKCMMLDIDEAKISGFQAPQVEAALRTYITSPKVVVKEKNKNSVTVNNHCNVILTSNDPKPISVPEGDRRYNVSPRQEVSLEKAKWLGQRDGEKLAAALRAELPLFAGYLADCMIDTERARRPMRTDEREKTIENSTTTPERIARAIKNGDLDYFLEEFWTGTTGTNMFQRGLDTDDSRRVLLGWAQSANPAESKRLSRTNVPASHVAVMFNFLMPDKFKRTPQEIGRALGLKADAYCGRGRAYRVTWQTKETAEELARIVDKLVRFNDLDAETEEDFKPEEPCGPAEAAKTNGRTEANCAPDSADVPRDHVEAPVENSVGDSSWDDTTLSSAADNSHAAGLIARAFVKQLDVDSDLASLLVREGFLTIEQIANVPESKLSGIEELDEEIVKELRTRARMLYAGESLGRSL
jgi:transcription termination factor NusA